MEEVGCIEPVIIRGRNRRGTPIRIQPRRCTRSNQTIDEQGGELAEQRPQRTRCLRVRRQQHPSNTNRNENETLGSTENQATTSNSMRHNSAQLSTSTRGQQLVDENTRPRRGLAFRLLSTIQLSVSSADSNLNDTIDISDASMNTTNDGSGFISNSSIDSITSGSVDRNISDLSVLEASASNDSDRDSSLNIVSSGDSEVSGVMLEPLELSGSSSSSHEVNTRPGRYSVITLDTTNDNNAPNTMNHEDSIVLVDSDTDTDYEEVIVVDDNVPEHRREHNKTNGNTAQPKPSVGVDENKNNENGVNIECPVCITSLRDIKNAGLTMQSTLCGHIFCSQCMIGLFQDNQTRINCPVCRKPIKRKEIHPIFI